MKVFCACLLFAVLTGFLSCNQSPEYRFVVPIAGTGVYRKPDFSAQRFVTLPFKTKVRFLKSEVIATDSYSQPRDWVKIDCGTREECWVSGDSLSPSVPELYFKVVTPAGLNLRSERSLQARIVTTLPDQSIGTVLRAGNEVEAIQKKTGFWFYTTYDGKSGWLFSGFTITSANKDELSEDWVSDPQPEAVPELESRSEKFWKSGTIVKKIDTPYFLVDEYSFPEIKHPTADNYQDYCGSPVSRIVFTNKRTGKSYSWQGYAERIARQDFPLPGMIEADGTVCNCCCAGRELRHYLLEADRVTTIRLFIKDQKNAGCYYMPMGNPILYKVEVRRSGNVWYSLVKKPLCQLTEEQESAVRRGQEVKVENVTEFSHITFLRLESTSAGFRLTKKHSDGIPTGFRNEWENAKSLDEDEQ